jgi:uncharacterized protein (DUF1778 family)
VRKNMISYGAAAGQVATYGKLPYNKPMRRTAGGSQDRRKTGRPKDYRFDARLNREQKMLIERAADLEGRTMTDFVLHSAEAAAERTIQQRSLLILTVRETQAFVNAILNPAEPRRVLRRAARQYKEQMGTR